MFALMLVAALVRLAQTGLTPTVTIFSGFPLSRNVAALRRVRAAGKIQAGTRLAPRYGGAMIPCESCHGLAWRRFGEETCRPCASESAAVLASRTVSAASLTVSELEYFAALRPEWYAAVLGARRAKETAEANRKVRLALAAV